MFKVQPKYEKIHKAARRDVLKEVTNLNVYYCVADKSGVILARYTDMQTAIDEAEKV